MSRKRYKKNPIETALPSLESGAAKSSPAVLAVTQRIASGGVEYLQQNLIRVMTDSAQLALEPEFIDLYLDDDKTVQVTGRWLKKYEKRLTAAQKRSPDEVHQVFDEMRIDVIEELATPAFRKDVDRRLQVILGRLVTSNDLEKLELVLILKPLLGMKTIPWGICGLILEIHQRTMQRNTQAYEAEQDIYGVVMSALNDAGEADGDLLELLEQPGKLDRIAQKLFGSQPGLLERAEMQVWQTIEAFENALVQGSVELNLFTEAELALPFERIQAEFGEPFKQVQPSEEMSERIFEAIRQALTEIMTPERLQRFREDVETTAKAWLRTHHKWAAALRFELGYLDGDEYEETKFFLAVFLGQVSRMGKEHPAASKSKKHR